MSVISTCEDSFRLAWALISVVYQNKLVLVLIFKNMDAEYLLDVSISEALSRAYRGGGL